MLICESSIALFLGKTGRKTQISFVANKSEETFKLPIRIPSLDPWFGCP